MKFSTLVRKSLTPLIALNAISMAASGGYLLFQGVWVPLWPAVLMIFLSPVVFPLLMFPAAFFAGVMRVAGEHYSKTSRIMAILSGGWLITILTAYVMTILHVTEPVLSGETLFPALIWSVSASVMPWAILALKDRDNVFFTGLVLMTQLSAIAAFLAAFSWALDYWQTFGLFWVLMVALVLIEMAVETISFRRRRKSPRP